MRRIILPVFLAGWIVQMILPADAAGLPSFSRAVARDRIVAVYAGKTWLWKDGRSGIYFGENGRIAASRRGTAGSSGTGNWSVDDRGRLCIAVHWRSGSGANSNSCWNHRTVGGVVWKQNMRSGQWYNTKGVSGENGRVRQGNTLQALER